MHDEVNLYRTHVWTCNRCGNTVKRSMNRPPQEADCRSHTKVAAAAAVAQGQPGSYCKDSRCWYHLHVKHCGGSYIKVSLRLSCFIIVVRSVRHTITYPGCRLCNDCTAAMCAESCAHAASDGPAAVTDAYAQPVVEHMGFMALLCRVPHFRLLLTKVSQ